MRTQEKMTIENLRKLKEPVVQECYTAKTIFKQDEKKSVTVQVPCPRIDDCIYIYPSKKWGEGRVCPFPNASANISDGVKGNIKKHRNR